MEVAKQQDEWLMAQVALDQREHLEPLVRRYAHCLLTFVRWMVGQEAVAEEIFQEVFLAVWDKRRQYRFPLPFKNWLYSIAANQCRLHLRRNKNRPTMLHEDQWETAPADDSPSPSHLAMLTETAAQVKQAVSRLPAQHRSVVVLRIWQELSYAEIAEIVGCSEATARSHMSHALAELRVVLPDVNQ